VAAIRPVDPHNQNRGRPLLLRPGRGALVLACTLLTSPAARTASREPAAARQVTPHYAYTSRADDLGYLASGKVEREKLAEQEGLVCEFNRVGTRIWR